MFTFTSGTIFVWNTRFCSFPCLVPCFFPSLCPTMRNRKLQCPQRHASPTAQQTFREKITFKKKTRTSGLPTPTFFFAAFTQKRGGGTFKKLTFLPFQSRFLLNFRCQIYTESHSSHRWTQIWGSWRNGLRNPFTSLGKTAKVPGTKSWTFSGLHVKSHDQLKGANVRE